MVGHIRGSSVLVTTVPRPLTDCPHQVRATLETVASQDWVRDKCSMQGSRLLEPDMLGDTSLIPAQSRYLLHLLCPYSPSALPSDSKRLAKTDPHPALQHVLKVSVGVATKFNVHAMLVGVATVQDSPWFPPQTLDQWTLRNALLHIDVHVQQATARTVVQDNLASEVIRVFEDSCGDEWLGQTIESSVESGDGSYRCEGVWVCYV